MAEVIQQFWFLIGLVFLVSLFVSIVFGLVRFAFIFIDRHEIKKKRKAFDRELKEMMRENKE